MIAATTTATSSILRILLISMLSASHVSDAFSFIPLSSSTTRNALTQIQLHQQLHQQQQQQQQPFMKRSCGGVTCTSSSSTSTSLYAEGGEEGKENDTEVTDTEAKGESDGDESSGASANDILNSPAFLKRKLEVLESDIAKIDEKISNANKVYEENKAEWGPQLDDLRKEYVNIQDRMKEKMKAGAGDANIEIARKILNVLDNYERAFGVVTPETDEEKKVEAAYKETYDMILKEFEEIGVKQVQTVGTEFNYEFHQAVMMRPDEDYEEGMVCEELAKGFAMEDGTLIRAAMVVVAA